MFRRGHSEHIAEVCGKVAVFYTVKNLGAEISHASEENEYAKDEHRFSDKFALAVAFHRNESGIPFLVAFGNGGFEFCFSGNRRGKRNGIFIKFGICGNNTARKVNCPGRGRSNKPFPCFGGDMFGPDIVAHADSNVCSVVVFGRIGGYCNSDVGTVCFANFSRKNSGGPGAVYSVVFKKFFGNIVFGNSLGSSKEVSYIFFNKSCGSNFTSLNSFNGNCRFKVFS